MDGEKEIVAICSAWYAILQNLHDPGGKYNSCHFTDEKTEVPTGKRVNFALKF